MGWMIGRTAVLSDPEGSRRKALEKLQGITQIDDPESFVRQLRRAVEQRTPELARERRRAAEGESWDRRATVLLQEI